MDDDGVITAPSLTICTVKFGSRFKDPKSCANTGAASDIDANTNANGAKGLRDLVVASILRESPSGSDTRSSDGITLRLMADSGCPEKKTQCRVVRDSNFINAN